MWSNPRATDPTETLSVLFLRGAGSFFVCRDGNFAVMLPASLLLKLANPWLICVGQKSRGTELLPFTSFPQFHPIQYNGFTPALCYNENCIFFVACVFD